MGSSTISLGLGLGGGKSGTSSGRPGGGSYDNTLAASLDGTDDYVGIAGLASRSLGALSMWVNITSTNGITSNGSSTQMGMLAGFGPHTGGTGGYDGLNWGSFLTTTDLLTLRANSIVIAKYQVPSAGDKLAAGWHHIVLTHNGTGYTFYIDGVIATSAPLSDGSTGGTITTESHAILTGSNFTSFGTPTIRIKIGGNKINQYYSQGLFDEVALFDTALSASQITTIYNSGVPGNISSLSPDGWWRMGDGTGDTNSSGGSPSNTDTIGTVADQSGNSNNASGVNGPTYSSSVPT
tara:strand:+ start:2138 stop:3019 length:882 start_codon:yes stop_codon:yes gene_type:complete